MRYLAIIAAVCLAIASKAGAQVASDEEQIRGARAESNQAISRHDVPGIVALLEEEYHVSASSGAFLSDRTEMGEAFAALFAEFEDAIYVRTPESVEVSTANPVASEIGNWVGSWTTAEGLFRTGGRYVAYWRKSQDRWRIHAELFVPLFCEGPGCD